LVLTFNISIQVPAQHWFQLSPILKYELNVSKEKEKPHARDANRDSRNVCSNNPNSIVQIGIEHVMLHLKSL
jgi:hypothetical protein